MIYTLTFAPALDYQMFLSQLTIGALNRASRTSFHVGGKGVNVSTVLRNLGKESVCLGFVSGFVGKEITRLLDEQNIRQDFIHTLNGCCRINVKLKAERETELNAFGPPVCQRDLDLLWQKIDQIQNGDMLIMSGNLPKDMEPSIYQKIAEMAKKKQVKAVVDASGVPLRLALTSGVYLVKPNLSELEALTGKKLETLADVAAEAQALRKAGAQNVLVSLGDAGALLASAAGVFHCRTPKGKLIDSTGAGDSMVASFAALSDAPCGDRERLRYAVACGSATAYSYELATLSEVQALLIKTPQAYPLNPSIRKEETTPWNHPKSFI